MLADTGVRCLDTLLLVLAERVLCACRHGCLKKICADLNLGRPTFRKTKSGILQTNVGLPYFNIKNLSVNMKHNSNMNIYSLLE